MVLYNSSLSAWSIVCTEYTFMTCNNELRNIHSCMEISNHEYSLTGIQCIRRVESFFMIGIIMPVKNTVRACVCAHMHAYPPPTPTHTHTHIIHTHITHTHTYNGSIQNKYTMSDNVQNKCTACSNQPVSIYFILQFLFFFFQLYPQCFNISFWCFHFFIYLLQKCGYFTFWELSVW